MNPKDDETIEKWELDQLEECDEIDNIDDECENDDLL